jgi:putative heme degradation protein
MSHETDLTPAKIRQAHSTHAKLRARDLAVKLGIREAQLVAAFAGQTATRIASRSSDGCGTNAWSDHGPDPQ